MKNNFLRKTAALLLTGAMITSLTLTGCGGKDGDGGSGGGDGKGVKIMYTTTKLDDFRQLLQDSIVSAGKAEGATIDVQPECATVDEQVAQIKSAASGGYDAVICLANDPTTALQMEADAGDIPIIFVNSLPSLDHLEKDKYMYVGSQEGDAGRMQAEFVWNKLGKPGQINAIIFEGEPGHSASIGRTAAVKEFFAENNVKANFVFDETGHWSDEEAAEKFDVFLKTGQDFDAVFCNNDTMATGIVKAFEDHGFDSSKIPIVGVDATEAGCQSIIDGGMQFTAYQSAAGQGEMCVKTAIALAKKGTAKGLEGLNEDGTIVWVPFEPVDASNVKDYL